MIPKEWQECVLHFCRREVHCTLWLQTGKPDGIHFEWDLTQYYECSFLCRTPSCFLYVLPPLFVVAMSFLSFFGLSSYFSGIVYFWFKLICLIFFAF